jgi:molybdenum cofactor cytidylyltransferase
MTGIVVLAAGESLRLGKPKQNLSYQHKTLLQHTVESALETECRPVIVVLGAYSEIVHPTIANQKIHIIHNTEWQEGMASSVRHGVAALQKVADIDSVLLLLCDQPFVDNELLEIMLYEYKVSGKGIVACAYNNTIGVPVLFGRKYFNALLQLTGNEGAKKLLSMHTEDILSVSFTLGSVDIDTMDDYQGLIA